MNENKLQAFKLTIKSILTRKTLSSEFPTPYKDNESFLKLFDTQCETFVKRMFKATVDALNERPIVAELLEGYDDENTKSRVLGISIAGGKLGKLTIGAKAGLIKVRASKILVSGKPYIYEELNLITEISQLNEQSIGLLLTDFIRAITLPL